LACSHATFLVVTVASPTKAAEFVEARRSSHVECCHRRAREDMDNDILFSACACQLLMLFGSPDEPLKAPEIETHVGSPNNVCDGFDLFKLNIDKQDGDPPKVIGDALTADGFDHMQVANCLIMCRPKTTAEAREWMAEHADGSASNHIAGQKVPAAWEEGRQYSMGSADRSFTVGEVVVLKRSDGSVKFGLLQQLAVFPDAHFILVECDADFQGRGTQAGECVYIRLCIYVYV
jgi:hypothetical protein